jgi:phospho-N-acetylmuramoyl-pentapeptide-transferase
VIDILLSGGLAMAVTALSGVLLIPALRKLKIGQSIKEIGPNWHMSKQGTPTMGGLMFMLGITAAVLAVGWPYALRGEFAHLFVLGFAWIYGVIGFLDDYHKVTKKQNLGLTALQKLALQLAVAAAFLALLRLFGYMKTDLYIPFWQVSIPMPWLLFAFCGLLVIGGMVNAVNFTDGVDGLCAGVTLPVAAFFTALGVLWSRPSLQVFGAALCGGLLGFLLFNFHPAKVFMGDTGSLFLGGAVCGLAFVFDAPLLLAVCGLVYILELLSVILQVGWFRLTKGKRLFRMSPLHHHFELGGWSEYKVFAVFTAATALLCAAAYFGVAGRYS